MKVLIVDDSHFITKTIERILLSEHPNWQTDVVHSTEEALKQIENKAYDYVTVDYNMPGENGSVVVSEVQAKYPTAKVALLTANKQKAMVNRAAEMGVTFIPKPDFTEALKAFFT
jgi:DNA-binding response OmpR family regulator